MAERDFCEWDELSGKYSLGFELVRLADIRRRQSNVHDVAVPVMREIRNEVNETVILSVRSGDFRVHVDFVEGLHPMRRMADLGVRAPLYAGAASKVLLAGLADDEIEAYLGRTDLTAFQKSTITDRNVLWREVRAIRKRGFAESVGELFAAAARSRLRSRSFPAQLLRSWISSRLSTATPQSTANIASKCCSTAPGVLPNGLVIVRGRRPTRSRRGDPALRARLVTARQAPD